MRTPRQMARRTASTYATVAAIWIFVSGVLVLRLPPPLEGLVEIAKGLAYVIRPASTLSDFRAHLKGRAYGMGEDGIWTHRDANGREFPVHVVTYEIDWDGHQAELALIEEVARVR
jgi:hypothetical protein